MLDFKNPLKNYGDKADFWSLYLSSEQHNELSFRSQLQQPFSVKKDTGALITVIKNNFIAYASTQDFSEQGIISAFDAALEWAERLSTYSLLKNIDLPFENNHGSYAPNKETKLSKVSIKDKLDLLKEADEALKNKYIVDTHALLWTIDTQTTYQNSLGADISQEFNLLVPSLSAIAHHQGVTQARTLGGMRAYCQQGGLESLLDINLVEQAKMIAQDAVDLVHAQNCPSETMDVLIDPDQMMLQIHESIGHPIELDRILGDERNYAGTSFVKLDMFGSYQYGSSVLNVSFDPTIEKQFASYGYDAEGTKAQKEFVIKDGILVRPLGARVSQKRAQIDGVANARCSSWNRPPIDRMANLNIEPGSHSFEEMLSSVEKGIYLKSNSSWSIDDSRNKFQFGCEWGQLIENGKLTKVVRSPNYRGISANFWRNLKMVGDISTRQVMGTPYCGKGEPNQCIRVGHASPVCLFNNVDVFGGE
ncbi:MAG: TldD/PmbA family protein [Myxococcales bacterium]|nr:TldD/PmbA family protein [Myxococcales bacterium]USN51379.1 MAG: TldD/PmbA family protein [Myxococcales bacterium]